MSDIEHSEKTINLVDRVITSPGYFPYLSEVGSFFSAVLRNLPKNPSESDVIKTAYSVAKEPTFLQMLPPSGLYKHSDGTISTDPEKRN